MIDTDKYENMRLLFLDFIADPMCEEDEAAWKRHLNTYDELLAEVKQLREKQIRYKNIVGEFDEFMCNNWTPDGVHSLWNELFSKYPATREEE